MESDRIKGDGEKVATFKKKDISETCKYSLTSSVFHKSFVHISKSNFIVYSHNKTADSKQY